MDLNYLIKLLWQRKGILFLSALLPALITVVFLSLKSKEYKSESLISTGVMGQGPSLNPQAKGAYVQIELIKMNFGSLGEQITKKSTVRLLSYSLLIHDLTSDTPYRTFEDTKLEESQQNDFVLALQSKLDSLDGKPLVGDFERIYQELSEELEYDYKSISEELSVVRKGETDYIAIGFTSEDSKMSADVVNTLTRIFLQINKIEQQAFYKNEFEFAAKLEAEKKEAWFSKKEELSNYRKTRVVLDVEAQSAKLVDAISELEMMKSEISQKIPAAKKAITKLNSYLEGTSTSKINSKAKLILENDEIQKLDSQIKKLRNDYVLDKKPSDLEKLEEKEEALKKLMEQYAKRESRDLVNSEGLMKDQNLANERVKRELELIDATENIKSINQALKKFKKERSNLVTDVASVSKLGSELTLLQDQYEQAKSKYELAKDQLDKAYQPLTVLEQGTPADEPESSKRALFSIFAGMLGAVVSVFSILLLGFMDNSFANHDTFKALTGLGLMGTVNKLENSNLNIPNVFSSNDDNAELLTFKESIRNIRYEIEHSQAKRFLFTSTKKQEGKTFIIINLTYALRLKGKRVLLIDTNFKNNELSNLVKKSDEKTKLLTSSVASSNLSKTFQAGAIENSILGLENIDIIGNKAGNLSPDEVFAGTHFESLVEKLENEYDYIFFESAALNLYSDGKELIDYVEKVIPVFAASSQFTTEDKYSIEFLKKFPNKLMGSILNKFDVRQLK